MIKLMKIGIKRKWLDGSYQLTEKRFAERLQTQTQSSVHYKWDFWLHGDLYQLEDTQTCCVYGITLTQCYLFLPI